MYFRLFTTHTGNYPSLSLSPSRLDPEKSHFPSLSVTHFRLAPDVVARTGAGGSWRGGQSSAAAGDDVSYRQAGPEVGGGAAMATLSAGGSQGGTEDEHEVVRVRVKVRGEGSRLGVGFKVQGSRSGQGVGGPWASGLYGEGESLDTWVL